jgi:hypothetical protein
MAGVKLGAAASTHCRISSQTDGRMASTQTWQAVGWAAIAPRVLGEPKTQY